MSRRSRPQRFRFPFFGKSISLKPAVELARCARCFLPAAIIGQPVPALVFGLTRFHDVVEPQVFGLAVLVKAAHTCVAPPCDRRRCAASGVRTPDFLPVGRPGGPVAGGWWGDPARDKHYVPPQCWRQRGRFSVPLPPPISSLPVLSVDVVLLRRASMAFCLLRATAGLAH